MPIVLKGYSKRITTGAVVEMDKTGTELGRFPNGFCLPYRALVCALAHDLSL